MTQIKDKWLKWQITFFWFLAKIIFEKIKKIGKKCGSVFIFAFLGPGEIGPKHM